YSGPKKKFSEWFRQKKRHGTTARLYRGRHKFQLGLLGISNLLFFALLITLFIVRADWKFVLGLYLIKLMVQWIVSYRAAVKLKEQDLMWLYPLLELIITLLQPVFYLTSRFTKQQAWK